MILIGLLVRCYMALGWLVMVIVLAPIGVVGHLLTLK